MLARTAPLDSGRAMVSYGAKVLALVVLLFDMQLVLFQNSWSGGMGTALVLGNYLAVVASALSILLSVLNHMGALRPGPGAARHEADGRPGTASVQVSAKD